MGPTLINPAKSNGLDLYWGFLISSPTPEIQSKVQIDHKCMRASWYDYSGSSLVST